MASAKLAVWPQADDPPVLVLFLRPRLSAEHEASTEYMPCRAGLLSRWQHATSPARVMGSPQPLGCLSRWGSSSGRRGLFYRGQLLSKPHREVAVLGPLCAVRLPGGSHVPRPPNPGHS